MQAAIDLDGTDARPFGDDVGEGIDGGLGGRNARQGGVDHGESLDLARHHRGGDLGRRRLLRQGIAHGRNTGAGVSSSSRSTSSNGRAMASERS